MCERASERVREILVNNRILFVNPFRSAIFIKSEFINFDYFIFSVVSSVRRSFGLLCTTPRACITAIPTQPNINPRVFFEQFLLLNSSFGFLFVSPFLAIDAIAWSDVSRLARHYLTAHFACVRVCCGND